MSTGAASAPVSTFRIPQLPTDPNSSASVTLIAPIVPSPDPTTYASFGSPGSAPLTVPPLTIVEVLAVAFLAIAFMHLVTRAWYRRTQAQAAAVAAAAAAAAGPAGAVPVGRLRPPDIEQPAAPPHPASGKVTILVEQPNGMLTCAVEEPALQRASAAAGASAGREVQQSGKPGTARGP